MAMGIPSTRSIVTFGIAVLTIGIGVAFAPEIKRGIKKLTGNRF